jgi:hypothetical protein
MAVARSAAFSGSHDTSTCRSRNQAKSFSSEARNHAGLSQRANTQAATARPTMAKPLWVTRNSPCAMSRKTVRRLKHQVQGVTIKKMSSKDYKFTAIHGAG